MARINEKSNILTSQPTQWIDSLAKKAVLQLFKNLKDGYLQVITPDGRYTFGDNNGEFEATLQINRDTAYRAIAFGGSVGAGEAYIDGLWSSPDIVQLISLFARNIDTVDTMEKGLARLFNTVLMAAYNLFQKNTREGSRKNIAAHYDLGNELFEVFLDETMMYSSAVYPNSQATLHEAQLNRLKRIGDKLQLTPEDHLLEIGSGWGALAVYMAQEFGCRVTTTTISVEQYNRVRERVNEDGLEERVTVLLKDYRELEGTFTKLVSIEMIEAVGYQFYDDYFTACSRLLPDDGLMLIQAILIDDRRYEAAKNEVDYIKRFIFPGSCIPSLAVINKTTSEKTDLSMVQTEDITPHYARTLHDWRARFLSCRSRLNDLGYDDTFIRMWDFYFAYCEAGFRERTIRTAQIMFAKPRCRQGSLAGAMNNKLRTTNLFGRST